MSEEYVLIAILVCTNLAALVAGWLRYKHGIWDGAFNQFLPHVQKAMREYDARRAAALLDGDGPSDKPWLRRGHPEVRP